MLIAAQFVVCFLLVFIPTFLSGASFPILIRMHSRGDEEVGRTVADVYAVNTFGGIIGSLVGGFVLIRLFGLQLLPHHRRPLPHADRRAAGDRARQALVATPATNHRRGLVAAVVLLAVFHPRFETKLIFAGWGPFEGGYFVNRTVGSTVDVTDRYMQKLLYHKEGVSPRSTCWRQAYGERSSPSTRSLSPPPTSRTCAP